MRRLTVPAAAFAAAVTLIAAPCAEATWPGANGRIAYVRGADVYTMAPNGGAVQRLTAFAPDDRIDIASWSPDASRLVFGHASGDEPPQLWTVEADGTNAHKVLDDPEFFDQYPSFTPDGRSILFMRCGPIGCPVARVRLDGTHLRMLTPTRPDIIDIAPTLAPDRSALTFGSLNRDGVIAGVYRARPGGAHPVLTTPPELLAFTPDWAPDSSRIAFQSNQLGSIYTMRPDGSDLMRLTHEPNVHDLVPSWSPQQDAIAFERDNADSSTAILVMRPDGTHVHQIKANARAPRWGVAAP